MTVRLIVAVCVSEPEMPVTVTVNVPGAAALLAVNVKVNVPLVVTDVGLKAAVTPLGRPLAESETVPVKPFCAPIVIVLGLPVPCAMLRVVGEAARVKFGLADAVTVRLMVAVCVREPETPVTVTVKVPVAAPALAVKVSVDEPLVVTDVGLNAAVTPLGRPEADSDTVPVKPLIAPIVIVSVPVPP